MSSRIHDCSAPFKHFRSEIFTTIEHPHRISYDNQNKVPCIAKAMPNIQILKTLAELLSYENHFLKLIYKIKYTITSIHWKEHIVIYIYAFYLLKWSCEASWTTNIFFFILWSTHPCYYIPNISANYLYNLWMLEYRCHLLLDKIPLICLLYSRCSQRHRWPGIWSSRERSRERQSSRHMKTRFLTRNYLDPCCI